MGKPVNSWGDEMEPEGFSRDDQYPIDFPDYLAMPQNHYNFPLNNSYYAKSRAN